MRSRFCWLAVKGDWAEKEKQNAILESAKNKFPQYIKDNSMILSLLINNIDKLPIRIERPSWSNGYHFLISEFDKKCVYGDYYKMGVLHNPNQELRLEKTGYRLFKDENRYNQNVGFMDIPDEIKDELPFH